MYEENIQNEIIKILTDLNFASDYYNTFIKKKIKNICERKFTTNIDNFIYKYFYNLYEKKEQINVEYLYSILYKKFRRSIDDFLITQIKKIRKKAYHDYYYNTHKKEKK